MLRCLNLAQNALRQAMPNPGVGAVLVFENRIIGEGATSPYGGAHAEVNCINSVKPSEAHLIEKSTLYVSLEPCSHIGKTPPCSLLITDKKIPHVVIACKDPNPLVAGKGINHLKENGVKVETGVLEQEAIELNKRFFTFHQKKRPYVILKWAQTPKGFFAPNNKEQFWITTKRTKTIVHNWRSQEMSILVGENTVLADNPRLNVRLVNGQNPVRILINTNKPLATNLHILDQTIPSIIFNKNKNETLDNLSYVKVDVHADVLFQIMDYMYENQIQSAIVEGGAYTLEQFIRLNLWDEARILQGTKELHQGIKAPHLSGTIKNKFSNFEDTITIIKNDLVTT